MDSKQAQQAIKDVLKNTFDRENFIHLIQNLLNQIEPRDKHYSGNLIPEAYRSLLQYEMSLKVPPYSNIK